jgi:ATP synthase protein I
MNKLPKQEKRSIDQNVWSRKVAMKANRKIEDRLNSSHGVWFGLGMMGLIGWSVALPTILGAALGTWLDKRHPGNHPWTLALLIAGLSIGCINAGLWVAKEDKEMREEQKINSDPGGDDNDYDNSDIQ